MEIVNITENTWSSIDIFLFSNGQQYSPPRKHHLRSDELQWWGATLSHLGRAHYGSGNSSIELYTIDGKKVTGPLELINGAAYVAVRPPDTFINTGYEEYLLKASRSREKRLAQKINNGNFPADDKNLNLSVIPDYNDENKNRLLDGKELSRDSYDPAVNAQSNKPPRSSLRKSSTNSKQIQRKKSSDSHKATIRKICAETNKILPCPRKFPLKRSEDSKRKRSSNLGSSNIGKKNIDQNQQPLCCKDKPIRKPTRNRDSKNTELQPVTDTANALTSSLLTSQDLLKPTDSIVTDLDRGRQVSYPLSAVDEQNVISLYKNDDTDLTSVVTDPEYDPIFDQVENEIIDNISVQKRIQENTTQESCKENHHKQMNETYDLEENNSFMKDFTKSEQEIDPVNNIPLQENRTQNQVTDQYLAFLNKGSLLLLKFHIKVKDCNTIFNYNRDKENNKEQQDRINDLLKTEKTSQVNIDIHFSGELLNPNIVRHTENKSLQSILYAEDNENGNSTRPKIIILQCACKEGMKIENICRCHEGGKKYTSSKNLAGPLTREPFKDSYRTSKDEDRRSNEVDQLSDNVDKPILSKSNGNHVKSLAQKFEASDKIIPYEKNGNYILVKATEVPNDIKPSLITKSNDPSIEEKTEEFSVPRNSIAERSNDTATPVKSKKHSVGKETNNTILKYVCDKATQTDWSNVLLEARRQEDDTYTFHLPPLYVLKQCKL